MFFFFFWLGGDGTGWGLEEEGKREEEDGAFFINLARRENEYGCCLLSDSLVLAGGFLARGRFILGATGACSILPWEETERVSGLEAGKRGDVRSGVCGLYFSRWSMYW